MMTRLIVVIGFAVAFFAGLIVGIRGGERAASRDVTQSTTQPASQERGGRSDPGSYLVQQLGLTPEQQQQMREIWSETAGRRGRQASEQRRRLREERDAAIVALIRPEDTPAYEAILKDYEDKRTALENEWRNAYQEAVEKTKAMLNPEQRAKYEQMLKQWDERDRDRHRGGSRSPATNQARPPAADNAEPPAMSDAETR